VRIPDCGIQSGKRLMKAVYCGRIEMKAGGGKWCVYRAVDVSEDLANRLLLGTAGRDPKTELKEQTKSP